MIKGYINLFYNLAISMLTHCVFIKMRGLGLYIMLCSLLYIGLRICHSGKNADIPSHGGRGGGGVGI